ncbi:hypothetical protein QKT49_gp052 [Acanthamoeba castellanii medusavirus]|uniref:4Fe-4S ferredoxin-type domain-containing protein n=1 Tax=Acanthamoeba castellanii medusavirus J1 TaxID=3114988 RepID=A0A3T1CWI4_9VIRU|nr:hypothetical protein QKT49_gp052 [Acanthamoeba castellanii medusavirus]BBI30192.1 hypothetical protein [Acanthamoeba castellanii medusavirus J1]
MTESEARPCPNCGSEDGGGDCGCWDKCEVCEREMRDETECVRCRCCDVVACVDDACGVFGDDVDVCLACKR